MEQNIDIEWSDVDKECLGELEFSVSNSFAIRDLGSCRVTLMARELGIDSELKTLSGKSLCRSSGTTVLEALWNLQDEYLKMMDGLTEMGDDLHDLAHDAENRYTRDEP